MDWTCLVVDLTGTGLAAGWGEAVQAHDFGMPVKTASSVEEAQALLAAGQVLTQVIFAQEHSDGVMSLLKAFQANVGAIAEFQAVVCDEPAPAFIAGVFEYGIEQFYANASWLEDASAMAREAVRLVSDPATAEAKTVGLTRTIRSADQAAITKAEENLGDLAEHDYRVAFAKGKAAEATGQYERASNVYASARAMNKMFRPSSASLGETLLVTGKVDEALKVLAGLERTNPFDVERKANLAAAYVEKGDFETAQKFVEQAAKLAPGNSRVLEARAQVLLCTGKIGDAFKLMDDMSEVGPFFAAKLNELGIQLSQAGKGKSALALYQKAHKIVRSELKYKISLNAALACRRLKAWDMAMKFAVRCEKEFGAAFPKLVKIKESIVALKAQEAKAGAKAKTDLEEAG
jgi:tetratricopeptide (TPR) repeat protein